MDPGPDTGSLLIADPLDPVQQHSLIETDIFRNFFVVFCELYFLCQGLIVNVSSIGGLRYLFNVAYGVGKAACDRMAADCALELKGSNVAMISLWPGAVRYLPRTMLRIFCLPGSGPRLREPIGRLGSRYPDECGSGVTTLPQICPDPGLCLL
jgi:NAD(P)-dependent dehydrogenase (short-subunit alcohol dehydrogenase family)